ncbi:hypothetical protein BDA99DRAFT_523366 [Phascolomyces articulosus]|uniref:Uncharacterized protein n=1 Tax=Phascolomyces articulosus TaxID=60185 RepID=A0AAD5K014_9FUNG|nr:hypothetical protein BDA99DRAFT_523366 [Phascolomyces articulosus]
MLLFLLSFLILFFCTTILKPYLNLSRHDITTRCQISFFFFRRFWIDGIRCFQYPLFLLRIAFPMLVILFFK